MSLLSKRLERRSKRLIFGALARKTFASVDIARLDRATIKKVLFVRANFRMGNLLLVTPALAATRHALPGARLDLLGTASHEALLMHHPDVDGVLRFSRRMLVRPWALAGLVRRIRRERYDLVVDCARGGSFLGGVLCGLSGGRYRVAAERCRYRSFFNVYVPRRAGHRHKIDLLLDLLEGIGIAPITRAIRIELADAERARAKVRWEAVGLPTDTAVVGVIVGGRGKKRYPIHRLLETVVGLRERMARVVLFVGPEDAEMVDTLRQAMPDGTTIVAPLALREFAAMLARCAVVVAPDTGPMHLGVALGVPTVAVLHSVASLSYRPLGPQHCVLYDEQGVPPAAVVAAVEAVLGGKASDIGAP